MGSKKQSSPPPPPPVPSPGEQAGSLYQAKLQYDPLVAQQQFDIYSNPQYGAGAYTAFEEAQRKQLFPQETEVRDVFTQNILQSLLSPNAITPDQQSALTARRGLAQNELVEALRTRANLGGGLYGGRAAEEEGRAVSGLQQAFAEEDIGRDERNRLNALQGAVTLLQLLYPDVNLAQPNFQSVVQDPNAYASSLVSQRGQDLQSQQLAAQQAQSNSALYGALFQGLGTAAGGFLGGPGGAMIGSSLFGRK